MQEQVEPKGAVNVLVIEDSRDDALLIRVILENEGFAVEIVDRLVAGIERVEKGDIDVVLLDLWLPDGHGLDNFRRMQAAAPDVPVIVLTGSVDVNAATSAVNEGAQDYLVKGHADGNLVARSIRYGIERQRLVAELRRLDEAKTQFIAAAAHELRTPLASLAGFAQMLSMHRKTMSEEQLERAFDTIGRQSQHVGTLVNNLLDLSEIEHGSLRVSIEPIDVTAALRRAVETAPAPSDTTIVVDADEGVK